MKCKILDSTKIRITRRRRTKQKEKVVTAQKIACNLNPVVVLEDIRKCKKGSVYFDTPPRSPGSSGSLNSSSTAPQDVASTSNESASTSGSVKTSKTAKSAAGPSDTRTPVPGKSTSVRSNSATSSFTIVLSDSSVVVSTDSSTHFISNSSHSSVSVSKRSISTSTSPPPVACPRKRSISTSPNPPPTIVCPRKRSVSTSPNPPPNIICPRKRSVSTSPNPPPSVAPPTRKSVCTSPGPALEVPPSRNPVSTFPGPALEVLPSRNQVSTFPGPVSQVPPGLQSLPTCVSSFQGASTYSLAFSSDPYSRPPDYLSLSAPTTSSNPPILAPPLSLPYHPAYAPRYGPPRLPVGPPMGPPPGVPTILPPYLFVRPGAPACPPPPGVSSCSNQSALANLHEIPPKISQNVSQSMPKISGSLPPGCDNLYKPFENTAPSLHKPHQLCDNLPQTSHQDSMQSSQKLSPTSQKIAPDSEKLLLTSQISPDSEKLLLTSQISPDSEKLPLTSQKISPDSKKLSPTSQKNSPDSKKLSPTSQKNSPDSKKLSPTSQKNSPDSKKLSPTSQKIFPGSEKLPETLENMRQTCLDMVQNSQNLPKSYDSLMENPLILPQTIENWRQGSQRLFKDSQKLPETFENLRQSSEKWLKDSKNLDQTPEEMRKTIQNFLQSSEKLPGTSNNLVKTAKNLIKSSNKIPSTTDNFRKTATTMLQGSSKSPEKPSETDRNLAGSSKKLSQTPQNSRKKSRSLLPETSNSTKIFGKLSQHFPKLDSPTNFFLPEISLNKSKTSENFLPKTSENSVPEISQNLAPTADHSGPTSDNLTRSPSVCSTPSQSESSSSSHLSADPDFSPCTSSSSPSSQTRRKPTRRRAAAKARTPSPDPPKRILRDRSTLRRPSTTQNAPSLRSRPVRATRAAKTRSSPGSVYVFDSPSSERSLSPRSPSPAAGPSPAPEAPATSDRPCHPDFPAYLCSTPIKEVDADVEDAQSDSEAPYTSAPHPGPAAPPKKRVKRKPTNWDPTVEYEVEEIVGYHRDSRQKMWYLVKWKDWPSEDNTFEPIENLTGCHQKLVRYFELVLPTTEDVMRKGFEMTDTLKNRELYKRIKEDKYTHADLEKFSKDCLDLQPLYMSKDLDELEKHMTKEFELILRCLIGMYGHQDKGLIKRAQDYQIFIKFISVRREQLAKIALSEKAINAKEEKKVTIENTVDLDTFPEIEYISEMRLGKGMNVLQEPLLGCECPGGCSTKSNCCGKISFSMFAYSRKEKVKVKKKFPIYECNSACKCPPTCGNRVVQRGRQVKLCIFKTKECGWGVKAMEKIPKGRFICQYIGELIPDSVAVVRDYEYFSQGKSGYLFDLDFFEDPKLDMYCIDATKMGNLARFINHSCDPNLVVYPVWVNCLAPNIHGLAFFAKKTIEKGQEINFDYENIQNTKKQSRSKKTNGGHWPKMISNLPCHCKAANCRNWVFGNK